MSSITMKDVKERFGLRIAAGQPYIEKEVTTSDISRPGLEMAGFFDFYMSKRIQVLGKTELYFFADLSAEDRLDRMTKLCLDHTPAFIVAHGVEVPPELSEGAEKAGIPVLQTDIPTTKFAGMLTNYLEGRLAPMVALHGVLVDVYGIGILITGKSGVGKSETALELVKRGHRLVADDLVDIRQVSKDVLIGTAPKLLEHMIEIRGVGIIDMMTLFGAGSVRIDKRVLIVIELEIWEPSKPYDRLGIEDATMKILDSEVVKLTVPVRPGRNLSVIIEVAAMNYRMKRLGINAAEQFSDRLNAAITEQPELSEEEGTD